MNNRQAFLDMIAWSEIGPDLLAKSDNGYNVLVGSSAADPHLFTSYADHPRVLVQLGRRLASTAAGRYQLLERYFDAYKKLLGLPDFSPVSQDAIALQQIRERSALPLIDGGSIEMAIRAVSNIWASLPGAGYGQHENQVTRLLQAYTDAGGSMA